MVKSFSFCLLWIYYTFNLGYLINYKIGNLNVFSQFITGFITLFASLYISAIPFILFKLPYKWYLIVHIVILFFSVLCIIKYKVYKFTYKKAINPYFLIICLILAIFYMFIDNNIGGDIQYYFASVAQNKINNSGIYNFEVWSGTQPYEKWIWYRMVPFELIQSFISSISCTSPNTTLIWIFPFFFIYTFTAINYEIITSLIAPNVKKQISFLYLVIFLIIFLATGYSSLGYHPYGLEYFLLLPFSGIAYLLYLFIPIFFLFVYKLFSYKCDDKDLKITIIGLGFLAVCFSSTGLFLFTLFVITTFFLTIIYVDDKLKRDKIIKILYCGFLPMIIYLLLTFLSLKNLTLIVLLLLLMIIYLVIYYFLYKILAIFDYKIINRVYFISFLIVIYSISIFIRKFSYEGTVSFRDFINGFQNDFLSNKGLIIIFIFCIVHIILNKKIELEKKIFYVYFNLIYILLFVNPISGIFVSKYITSNGVYWRLFYGISVIYSVIYLFELFRERKEENITGLAIISIVCIEVIQSFTSPVNDYYWINPQPLSVYNYSYKIEQEKYELYTYLANKGECTILTEAELYRKGLRGIAPNVILFTTVYDDRIENVNNNVNVEIKKYFTDTLERREINNRDFYVKLKEYNIDYLVVSKKDVDINSIYYDLDKEFNNYYVLKIKQDGKR
ncbi:DUF6077 domain-containing protein [Turicibacter sanguinis]|uniref:DUF6077 domain-containing protein n=1 Tax=Turicibacter sanguinis TaxID=154288 RepID=UPI0021D4DD43|nr:DUF6077 domain-containing protein [Turicibacter sanguinis]MCU7203351.1 DUF6077 domain-containing protein [Turicibacter sanguinis]